MRGPLKTKREQRNEARIVALKAAIAEMQRTLTQHASNPATRDDFAPDSRTRIRPIRRWRHTYNHASAHAPDENAMKRLLSIPTDLHKWVQAIAKPGERITIEVLGG